MGRQRQCATTHTETAKAAEVRVTEEEQGASSTMGSRAHGFSVEPYLDIFCCRQERQRKRQIFILRHEAMVGANRTWDTVPLKNDDAPRRVTFQKPFLPPHYHRRRITEGGQPSLREPTTDSVMRKRQAKPATAAVSTVVVQEVI